MLLFINAFTLLFINLMQVMGSLEAAMAIAKTAVRGRRGRPFVNQYYFIII